MIIIIIRNFWQIINRSYQTTTALATDGDEDEEGAQERQPLSIEVTAQMWWKERNNVNDKSTKN